MHLFLDVDGVLQAPSLRYPFAQTRIITQRVPSALVHPSMRARPDLPEWVMRRRGTPEHVTFRTSVRTSTRLHEDIAALGGDVRMLTTWLEHDSVDAFFADVCPSFEYRKLRFPARDHADPAGEVPARWKVDELIRTVDAQPRPFIWADDDEVPVFAAEVRARYRQLPMLLLAPDSNLGLTTDHVAQMREFASAHR